MTNLIRSDWSDPRGGANTVAGRLQSTPAHFENKALSQFLREASSCPFAWGQHDCLSWLGAWVAVRHGTNPADRFTRRYRTARGALRIIREHGSMGGVVRAAIEPMGLVETDEPQAGDIAIVSAPEGLIGGIVAGKFIANIGQHGLFMRRLPIVTAWRV